MINLDLRTMEAIRDLRFGPRPESRNPSHKR